MATRSTPLHMGWASKLGQQRSNWKRRFFVFYADGVMAYYSDERSAHLHQKPKAHDRTLASCATPPLTCSRVPQGTLLVDVHAVVVQESLCRTSWPEEKRLPSTGFGIQTQSRTYYLHCSTVLEASQWITCLEKYIGSQEGRKGAAPQAKPTAIASPVDAESSDEDTPDSRKRLPTVAFAALHSEELAATVKSLLMRNEDLNRQALTLQLQLSQQDETNRRLLMRMRCLENMLVQAGISFAGMGNEATGFPDPADAVDLAKAVDLAGRPPVGGLSASEKQRQERAAMVIQRFWRGVLLKRRFEKIRAAKQQEKQERAELGLQPPDAAARGRGASHLRQQRVPSTSLGIRRSTLGLAQDNDRRLMSLNQRPLPPVQRFAAPPLRFSLSVAPVAAGATAAARSTGSLKRGTLDMMSGFSAVPPPSETDTLLQKLSYPECDSEYPDPIESPLEQQQSAGPASPAKVAVVSAAETSPTLARSPSGVLPTSPEPSPASSTPSRLPVALPEDTQARAARVSRAAIYRFNSNPNKGLKDLISAGLVRDDPKELIRFLCEEPGISRAALGELLGLPNERGAAILHAYSETFDFRDSAIDRALRLYLLSFRIPGEAQKIERVLTSFSKQYHADNAEMFRHEDTALILAFSIMMLHTDLHNPSNPRKMSEPDFVRNNRGIDDGEDLPQGLLKGIYQRVKVEEFQCCMDHTTVVEELAQRITQRLSSPLVTEARTFVREVVVTELSRSKAKQSAKRVVNLMLFNDLLLVLSRSRWERRYDVRREIPLTTAEVRQAEKGTVVDVVDTTTGTVQLRFSMEEGAAFAPLLKSYILQTRDAVNTKLELLPPAASEC